MHSSSGDYNGSLLDDTAHEAAWVPVGCVCVSPVVLGATDHQHVISLVRQVELDLPLAEAVFAFVLAEIGLLPILAAISGEVHARHTRIATARSCSPMR
jgi:hypothetical protein